MLCDKVFSREKSVKEKKMRILDLPGRTKQWWLEFLTVEVVADEWKENFRMSKQSLLVLCEELRQYIIKNTKRF